MYHIMNETYYKLQTVSENTVLIRQQFINAYNDFVRIMINILNENENKVRSLGELENDNNDIKIVLFRDGVPTATVKLEIENEILGIKFGIFRYVIYYDSRTLTYRIRGGIYSILDFSFVLPELEKQRQILEIVHALYILNYSNGYYSSSQNQIKNLVKKFKFLTNDSANISCKNANISCKNNDDISFELPDFIDESTIDDIDDTNDDTNDDSIANNYTIDEYAIDKSIVDDFIVESITDEIITNESIISEFTNFYKEKEE